MNTDMVLVDINTFYSYTYVFTKIFVFVIVFQ